ncbi:hypothetical protein [Escherichia coli]|uniref:hypothetical protein n=1 Tax=Escherichia coli TaxID=562 RepID=UPI0039A06FCE
MNRKKKPSWITGRTGSAIFFVRCFSMGGHGGPPPGVCAWQWRMSSTTPPRIVMVALAGFEPATRSSRHEDTPRSAFYNDLAAASACMCQSPPDDKHPGTAGCHGGPPPGVCPSDKAFTPHPATVPNVRVLLRPVLVPMELSLSR